MNIKVIGLCGRSGSGKGFISNLFNQYNIPSIDTDEIYNQIIHPVDGEISQCVNELIGAFGPDILKSDNSLNKKELAKIVFQKDNDDQLLTLNKITHKYILELTKKYIYEYDSNNYKAVIIDAPVLFESGFNRICDYTVCVTAPDEILIERLKQRDTLNEKSIQMRLSSQKSNIELIELCDYQIINDNKHDLIEQIEFFIRNYL